MMHLGAYFNSRCPMQIMILICICFNVPDARKRVGCVIGVDLLPIAPLKGATFLDGCDFTSLKTTEQIKNLLTTRCQTNHEKNKSTTISMENDNGSNTHAGKPFPNKNQTNSIPAGPTENSENGEFLVDAVLSDMAPNASGQREMDHFRLEFWNKWNS